MKQENSNFSSKIGFILAAAGSAVGLGNIWRFPYLAAKYGGGIFLIIYLILAVTFGFALMITEIAIGRKTGKSALGAFRDLAKKHAYIGYLASIVPIIIFPYYCVIGGWVLKYLVVFLTGQGAASCADGYFSNFIGQVNEPLIWLIIFILLSAFTVMMGVEKGVEKVSTFLMPILVILTVIIAVYCITREGSGQGLAYYLIPDFSRFSFQTVLAAMGQLFYSMSLAMGIMITYGSYVSTKDDVESAVRHIEIFDTAIAFLSGLIIIPAVFVFSGGDPSVLSSGPSLMFITLPKVFESMAFGGLIGTIFFVLVLFAALTSAISLMETVVSIVMEKTKMTRIKASLLVLGVSLILGAASSLGFGVWSDITPLGYSILDFFDFISNSVLMPIVAFLTCVFVGFIIKPKTIVDEVKLSGPFKSEKIYTVTIKYIAPILILLILFSSLFIKL